MSNDYPGDVARGAHSGGEGASRPELRPARGPLEVEELARMLSHDLRTPLSVMLLQAEIINRLPADPRTVQRARTILSAGRQLSTMIQDVVDVLRLEAGAARLEPELVAVGELLSRPARETPAGPDGRRVELRLEPGLPPVRVDVTRMERAISHLLANALQHSPPESTVVLRAHRVDGRVEISVADDGEGIAPEDLPHILDPVYRTDTVRRGHGLGIGLYLCDLTARAHGGSISATSLVGRGSTFTISLPAGSD